MLLARLHRVRLGQTGWACRPDARVRQGASRRYSKGIGPQTRRVALLVSSSAWDPHKKLINPLARPGHAAVCRTTAKTTCWRIAFSATRPRRKTPAEAGVKSVGLPGSSKGKPTPIRLHTARETRIRGSMKVGWPEVWSTVLV